MTQWKAKFCISVLHCTCSRYIYDVYRWKNKESRTWSVEMPTTESLQHSVLKLTLTLTRGWGVTCQKPPGCRTFYMFRVNVVPLESGSSILSHVCITWWGICRPSIVLDDVLEHAQGYPLYHCQWGGCFFFPSSPDGSHCNLLHMLNLSSNWKHKIISTCQYLLNNIWITQLFSHFSKVKWNHGVSQIRQLHVNIKPEVSPAIRVYIRICHISRGHQSIAFAFSERFSVLICWLIICPGGIFT